MFDIRSIVIGTVSMLKKYTCVNVAIYEEANETDYKNGIMALPLIGIAIGFGLFFISFFRYIYDGFFIGALALLYYYIITRGVNIKDVYHTLNHYIKPYDTSENIGGIIGVIIVLLIYYSLFRIVPLTALIIMPSAGFSSLIILSRIITGNKDNTSILKHCDKYHIISAFFISFLFTAILNYKLIISLALNYMLITVIVSLLNKKIKSMPPSMEGFIIEVSQILFLTITCLFKL